MIIQNSGLMNKLLKIVRSAAPDTGIQFRRETYGNGGIRHFLRDVLAMANAAVDGPRYIITGAEVDEQGQKKLFGVTLDDFSGKPSYQSLVTEFIEPPIRVRYQPISLNRKQVGVFEIANCQDKPYMMRIDQSEKLRRGDAYIRTRNISVKMGRQQLQTMFEKKFRDSVSADRIEIGFPGEIIHKDLSVTTIDLSQLPSTVAGAKLDQLMEVRSSKRNKGATSGLARLTHARLFGSDDPYQERSESTLIKEMAQLKCRHRYDDECFLYEKNARKLQLVVYNQGDEAIEDASLSLVIPTHNAFFVANKLPKLQHMGKYADRSSTELADYPTVNLQDDLVHVCNLGSLFATRNAQNRH